MKNSTGKEQKRGLYTLFESINDYEVAKALFDAALSWLKERGITTVTGLVTIERRRLPRSPQ